MLKAYAHVQSRSIGFGKYTALVPFVELVNHSSEPTCDYGTPVITLLNESFDSLGRLVELVRLPIADPNEEFTCSYG